MKIVLYYHTNYKDGERVGEIYIRRAHELFPLVCINICILKFG